jgi:hypothetical protein
MSDNSYQTLERQIARIHRLLEALDAEVTWNDRIPDPDNPKQQRQIDITIRRGERLTVVECRAWQVPQDATWVEQLHGRRPSLNADAVIGVSSSGFTDTAILKARRLGVILRDFETLSPGEIEKWGGVSTLTLISHEFRDVEVTITMPVPYRESDGLKITTADGQPISPRAVLMTLVDKLKLGWQQSDFVRFHERMNVADQRINGIQPLAMEIKGRMRNRQFQTEQPSVAIYGNAGDSKSSMEASVERFTVGQTQVIKGPELSSIIFDLSKVKIPDRCILASPLIENSSGLRIKNVEVVGIDNWLQSKVQFKYVLQWSPG